MSDKQALAAFVKMISCPLDIYTLNAEATDNSDMLLCTGYVQ
jgi:hypothetical protein